jgi:hypothetical protein
LDTKKNYDYGKVIKKIDQKLKKKHKKEKKLILRKKRKNRKLVVYYTKKKHLRITDNTGLILIIIGFCFFINSIFLELIGYGFILGSVILNLKLGTVFSVIGFFIIFILTTTDTYKLNKDKKIYSKKITYIVIIWIITIFLITLNEDLDVFLILIILGILTLKELTEEFMNIKLKNNMKYLSYIIVIIFFAILSQRIIYILNR